MRRNFEELRRFLHSHYPALAAADSVRGELYPPPPMAETLAALGTLLQMAGIALVFGGSLFFNMLGIPEPSFLPFLKRNTTTVVIGLFFLNSILSSFQATGAFEVLIDGELVFSKLREKAFPKVGQIMRELDRRGLVRVPGM